MKYTGVLDPNDIAVFCLTDFSVPVFTFLQVEMVEEVVM